MSKKQTEGWIGHRTESEFPKLKKGTRVNTPNGLGVTIGISMRRNTNGGPGCEQYVVQLDDGRIRHYGKPEITVAT